MKEAFKNSNKGLTLIEILGVVVVLGLIATITIPIINNVIKANKEKLYQRQISSVKEAASNWVSNNTNKLQETTRYYLDFQKLSSEGYLKHDKMINPLTNSNLSGCVFIKWDEANKQYSKEYIEDCSNVTNGPIINNLSSVTALQNSEFNPNVTVSYTNGATEPLRPSSITRDGVEASVDTSIYGAVYIIKYTATDPLTSITNESTTTLTITDNTAPIVTFNVIGNPFNEDGWSKTDINIRVLLHDNGSGGKSFKYCTTTSNTCVPSNLVSIVSPTITLTSENVNNKVCVIGYDNDDNESDVVCSEVYKIDKTAPVFSGITNYVTTINTNVSETDLRNGVTVTGGLSGGSTYRVSPISVSSALAGPYSVTYTATDGAGNITSVQRTVQVNPTRAPEVSYTPSSTPTNAGGWSKADVVIPIGGTDHSGHGIDSVKYCITNTEVSCTPNISISVGDNITVTTEGERVVVCIQSVSNYQNQTSEVTCLPPLKIDKTPPTFSGLSTISVYVGSTVDETYLRNGVTANGGVSGGTTYSLSPTSVNTSLAGTYTVTYSSTDNASNTASNTRTINVVPQYAPRIDYSVPAGVINGNGWAKANFNVTLTATDYSGHGISGIKYCTTTSETCEPSTNTIMASFPILISTGSATNKICAEATSSYNNQKSGKICSGVYKLDKVGPTFSGLSSIMVLKNGSINLTSGVTVSDTLSNVVNNTSFTYTPTSISNTTIGTTTVTYQSSDIAGNTTTNTRTVTVNSTLNGELNYTGTSNQFAIDTTGTYVIEAYGAQGGGTGGNGGYVKAEATFNKGDVLTVVIGGTNGYNGGGSPADATNGFVGGGATTISLNGTNYVVAAGGGAGTGGTSGGSGTGRGGLSSQSGYETGTVGSNGTNGGGGGTGIVRKTCSEYNQVWNSCKSTTCRGGSYDCNCSNCHHYTNGSCTSYEQVCTYGCDSCLNECLTTECVGGYYDCNCSDCKTTKCVGGYSPTCNCFTCSSSVCVKWEAGTCLYGYCECKNPANNHYVNGSKSFCTCNTTVGWTCITPDADRCTLWRCDSTTPCDSCYDSCLSTECVYGCETCYYECLNYRCISGYESCNCSSCHHYTNGSCTSYNQVCTYGCDSCYDSCLYSDCVGGYENGTCKTYATNTQTPGNGGTNSIKSGLTIVSNTSGSRTGNGYVKITCK